MTDRPVAADENFEAVAVIVLKEASRHPDDPLKSNGLYAGGDVDACRGERVCLGVGVRRHAQVVADRSDIVGLDASGDRVREATNELVLLRRSGWLGGLHVSGHHVESGQFPAFVGELAVDRPA